MSSLALDLRKTLKYLNDQIAIGEDAIDRSRSPGRTPQQRHQDLDRARVASDSAQKASNETVGHLDSVGQELRDELMDARRRAHDLQFEVDRALDAQETA